MKNSAAENEEQLSYLKVDMELLERSVVEKTQFEIKKFLAERERINTRFDRDPHQSTNRLQQSKFQLEL